MADDENVANRLWRVEQRQIDALQRLDRLEERVNTIAEAQERRMWRTQAIEERLSVVEKRPSSDDDNSGALERLVRVIMFGLLTLISALAGAKIVGVEGLLGTG